MSILHIVLNREKVQFLLGLENICNRLVIVPKPARVSALRAELTALNHKLPAEVNPIQPALSNFSAIFKSGLHATVVPFVRQI